MSGATMSSPREDSSEPLRVRAHENSGALVFVLHGGPGAPGSAGPLAEGLANSFRVIEPWQRHSSDCPLTVAQHFADLYVVVRERCGHVPAPIVGHSWGAMLALAYAAAHPEAAGPLVLVGCGTFDQASRTRLVETRASRLSPGLGGRMAPPPAEGLAPAERLAPEIEVMSRLDTYAAISPGIGSSDRVGMFDRKAFQETWDDMLRLQNAGVYPAAFGVIRSLVLMIHGDYDPHPGVLIRASLAPHLSNLAYVELPRCGHYPWNERHAREDFFRVVRAWLSAHV